MMENMLCPTPKLNYERIQMVHGAGGLAMSQLVDRLFQHYFNDPRLREREDATILAFDAGQMAISTDCFVVDPLFFPGGDIGSLAINGTVNDVAMSGAIPMYLTVGFILEEGLLLSDLERVLDSMRRAAQMAGVSIVAGDTKVVHRGKCDKLFITTTGVGRLERPPLSCHRIEDGDAILVSGSLGDHGIAVLSQREGLDFETEITSDCAALNGLIQTVYEQVGPSLHACRDATRGGLTAVLNEFAQASDITLHINETQIPVKPGVHAACEMLGLDPKSIANEGKMVLCVAKEAAQTALACLRSHPLGKAAEIIGRAEKTNEACVILNTAFGTHRVLDLPVGEPLPRIC